MEHAFVFPAIRGVQAGREYYVSMCPLRIIPKLFLFDEEELSAEVRAQRTLNQNRIPDIARYILKNRDDYVFSSLTASIDGDVKFDELEENDSELQALGHLQISMSASFVINDGQHRRAAIETALREDPTLGSETISVVFFVDSGLERSQQMFADLNRNAVRPSKSLGVLYDHRDEMSHLTRLVVFSSDFLEPLVELEKTSLSLRSRKLFTLSSLHNANQVLIEAFPQDMPMKEKANRIVDFWEAVAEHIDHWQEVRANEMTSGDVRGDFIHSHSLTLEALANVGRELLEDDSEDLEQQLEGLAKIDWSRENPDWEGRALKSGSVVNSRAHVTLTTAYIKQHLGLPLTDKQLDAEASLNGREVAYE